MNGKRAKLIRKLIYRTEDPRDKQYQQLDNGQILSTLHRQVFQEMKKECRHMTRKEIIAHLQPINNKYPIEKGDKE